MKAEQMIKQDTTLAIVLAGALEHIAEANGRTFEETAAAFTANVPAVRNAAAKLCAAAFRKLEEVTDGVA